MSLRSSLGAVRRELLCRLHRRLVPLKNSEALVSFTFDDFPRTALSAGGAILENFGARGTYYAASGLMNTVNELGEQFCPGDLEAVVEAGHELASHTYHHISSRAVSGAGFYQDVEKGRKAIEEVVGAESGNFAYPFGDVTLAAKKTVGPAMGSCRSIFPGLNGPEADLNLLRANSLYGGLEGAHRAEELIAENSRRKSWLIFYTHDVRPNPSPYGCTPALFEAVVSNAARKGAKILTVGDALREIGGQPVPSPVQGRKYVTL
jgi:peptidoglycan/xylan/chitin deacetylase (PgdA/CDA1 family)